MNRLTLITCLLFLSLTVSRAQEAEDLKVNDQKNTTLSVKIKEHSNADVYVDGKKFEFDVEIIDPNKIASISVIKGEQALKKYNAPNGVLLITTKPEKSSAQTETITLDKDDKIYPLVIIDGEVSSQEKLKKLSPENIEKIDVYKEKMAKEKYNAPNGAIVITTKKGVKK